MAEYEGLSQWMRLACLFAGCALILFLFSASSHGWNFCAFYGERTYEGSSHKDPHANTHPPNSGGSTPKGTKRYGRESFASLVVNLGAAAFFFLAMAMMIFLSIMQVEMNQIAHGFICALSFIGGLLLFACVAIFEGLVGYAPVSSSIGMIGSFCAFLAFIFCILDLKGVAVSPA